MKSNWMSALAGAALLVLSAPAALAQAGQPIELKGDVKVSKQVVENGTEKQVLSEPKVVVPGDRLIFSTSYRNTGGETVRNFVVTNPIPNGVMLAPEGAAEHSVSVDGGKSWGKLASLSVNNGEGAMRPAVAGDVTHVRWVLPEVAPGAEGKVTYNAIVR